MPKIRQVLLILMVVVSIFGTGVLGAGAQSLPAAGSVRPAAADTVTIKVLNPQGAVPATGKLAPRLSTLDGKRVVNYLLLPNTFEFQPAGKAFFASISEQLKKQFPKVTIVDVNSFNETGLEDIQKEKPDAVILGVGG